MLKVHCVGCFAFVWGSSFGLVGYARFWFEGGFAYLSSRQRKGGEGGRFVARAFIYRTPALKLEVGVGV